MLECESEKEKERLNEVADEVTPFYKEAFNCFDWNNSGRIYTNVSKHFNFESQISLIINNKLIGSLLA